MATTAMPCFCHELQDPLTQDGKLPRELEFKEIFMYG